MENLELANLVMEVFIMHAFGNIIGERAGYDREGLPSECALIGIIVTLHPLLVSTYSQYYKQLNYNV